MDKALFQRRCADASTEVVHELEFHPNQMAQGLRRGRSSTVALLVGDIEQNHFSATTKHIQSVLTARGLDLLLYNLGHSDRRLCEILDRAIGMHLRAIIIASSDRVPLKSALHSLQEPRAPRCSGHISRTAAGHGRDPVRGAR